jgi:hypothetical protein
MASAGAHAYSTSATLKVAQAMNRLPVAFWQSMQWHRLVKTGSPATFTFMAPQRQEPVLVAAVEDIFLLLSSFLRGFSDFVLEIVLGVKAAFCFWTPYRKSGNIGMLCGE